MRKMYTTKRLLGSVTCAAALLAAAPMAAQEAVAEEDILASDAKPDADQKVEQSATGEIDLHVKELEITKVLQLLSIQSEKNIIASRDVENIKVSADLYKVSFEDALRSILEPNGLGFVEEGNFIYVMSKEKIKEREQADRKPKTVIHRLSYLRADEAAAFVTPMLSENGTITASGNVEDGFDPNLDNGGADNYAGTPTLVIRDYEDKVEEVLAILKELDKQPKQVIVEATVLRATLTENNQFGVDFSLFTDLTGASPLDIIDGAISGGAPTAERFGALESGGNFDSDSAVKLGFVAGDAAVFVSALDSVTDTTLIATPKVTVLDRNRTSILVGEKIAYLSTTVTETSETQTVEFLEVGTQLNVRPFVSNDGKIRLELRPSVSDATIRTIGTTSAPDESTVELQTNVIVESGQTIVLGGLFTDDTTISRNQVPGLGDVPILGAAFQGQDDTVGRSEVIFLVKATVVENETLVELGKEGMARVDVARLAEREQLLPWSRSKLTAAHIVNARKLYDEALTLEGKARDDKMAEALRCVDWALHMNPSMVDALILKQQITGEASYIKYEESIVTETYDAVLDEAIEELDLPEPQGDAEELVEPDTLTEGEAEAETTAEAPAEQAAEQALAEAETAEDQPTREQTDEQWLENILAEEFGSEAEPQAEATEEPLPVDEPIEELAETTEDSSEFADPLAEDTGSEPADDGETTDVADAPPAEDNTETDISTADVPTETD